MNTSQWKLVTNNPAPQPILGILLLGKLWKFICSTLATVAAFSTEDAMSFRRTLECGAKFSLLGENEWLSVLQNPNLAPDEWKDPSLTIIFPNIVVRNAKNAQCFKALQWNQELAVFEPDEIYVHYPLNPTTFFAVAANPA